MAKIAKIQEAIITTSTLLCRNHQLAFAPRKLNQVRDEAYQDYRICAFFVAQDLLGNEQIGAGA